MCEPTHIEGMTGFFAVGQYGCVFAAPGLEWSLSRFCALWFAQVMSADQGVCCRCNGTKGTCLGCACVKAGRNCTNCSPANKNRCQNLHSASTISARKPSKPQPTGTGTVTVVGGTADATIARNPRAATAEELAMVVLGAAPSAPALVSNSQQLAWD
eukprot:scpid99480/ scgid30564/ 